MHECQNKLDVVNAFIFVQAYVLVPDDEKALA
jgi:hypothetical protein